MDEARLQIFCQALPDPTVVLFQQEPYTFTSFNKLAIELRTAIWHASFPRGRKVHVQTTWKGRNNSARDSGYLLFRSCEAPPATFWVSRESRTESLKHYRVLLQDVNDSRLIIYFHPTLDTVVFPNIRPLEHGRLFPKVSFKLMSTFARIESLELHKMWWSRIRTALIGPDPGIWCERMVEHTRADIVAGYFKGLHELVLYPSSKLPCKVRDHLTDPRVKGECTSSLEYFFTIKAQEVPGFRIPQIDIVIPEDFEASDETGCGSDVGWDDGADDMDESDGYLGLWDRKLDDLDEEVEETYDEDRNSIVASGGSDSEGEEGNGAASEVLDYDSGDE